MSNIVSNYTDQEIFAKHKSYIDRYYNKRYHKAKENNEDICILEHSNRICIVTLSHLHPIVNENKIVLKVDYLIEKEQIDKFDLKVTGRHKRGAKRMNMNSVICKIHCEDGSVYLITIGFNAYLIEINHKLVEHPQLLVNKTESCGYIAVILTQQQTHNMEMNKLLSALDYETLNCCSDSMISA